MRKLLISSKGISEKFLGKLLDNRGSALYLRPINRDRIPAVGALPLKLLSFQGSASSNRAELNWTVNENETGERFEIERSTDALAFQTIAILLTTGNSGQQAYKMNDAGFNTQTGNYYRLKLINKDLNYAYSSVILIRGAKGLDAEIKLLQNPVVNTISLTLNVTNAGQGQMNLYDLNGHLLKAARVTLAAGSNALQMDLDQQLAAGVYVLEVMHDGVRSTARIVKN